MIFHCCYLLPRQAGCLLISILTLENFDLFILNSEFFSENCDGSGDYEDGSNGGSGGGGVGGDSSGGKDSVESHNPDSSRFSLILFSSFI